MDNIIGEGRFGDWRRDATNSSQDAEKSWVEGEAAIDPIIRVLRGLETINQNGGNHEGYRRIIDLVIELRNTSTPEREVRDHLDREIARHAMLLAHIRHHCKPPVIDLPPYEPPYGDAF